MITSFFFPFCFSLFFSFFPFIRLAYFKNPFLIVSLVFFGFTRHFSDGLIGHYCYQGSFLVLGFFPLGFSFFI